MVVARGNVVIGNRYCVAGQEKFHTI